MGFNSGFKGLILVTKSIEIFVTQFMQVVSGTYIRVFVVYPPCEFITTSTVFVIVMLALSSVLSTWRSCEMSSLYQSALGLYKTRSASSTYEL